MAWPNKDGISITDRERQKFLSIANENIIDIEFRSKKSFGVKNLRVIATGPAQIGTGNNTDLYFPARTNETALGQSFTIWLYEVKKFSIVTPESNTKEPVSKLKR